MNCPPEGFLIPAEFSEVIDQCLRKRKSRLGERLVSVLTDVALCEGQDCQSPAIHQREKCGPHCSSGCTATDCGIGQCTVRPQNSRHHRHPNRNIQAGHHTQCDCEWCYYRPNGRTARTIIVVGVTLPGGTSSCCWCTAWVHFTLCEVISAYRPCLPGTERPVKSLGHGADSHSGPSA